MMQILRSRQTFALLFALMATAACGDSTSPPPQPGSIATVGPAAFTGAAGDLIPQDLVVRVTDAGGTPVADAQVVFSIASGGGSLSAVSATTNLDGLASTRWTLGPTIGEQRVQATVGGVSSSATFVAVASAGAPAEISITAGNNQSGPAGAAVATRPTVLVVDRFDNPVPGVSVFFSVSAGGGSVTGSGATTDAAGLASVGSWQLGPAVGVNRLTALAVFNGVSGNPVEFTATATAGTAATLSARTSTTLSGVVGSSITPLPSVLLTDAAGNPVSGVQVTFAPSTGSTATGLVTATDAAGVATVSSWQLGTSASSYSLSASAAGVATPVVFTAAARAAAPANVSAVAGNGQSAPVGRPVDIEPSVRVTDGFGNPVSGVAVEFTVTGGDGFAFSRNQITNANGIATVGGWTLGDTPGANTLRAQVTGTGIAGNPVTFTATGTPGVPATITLQAGNAQTAQVGTAVPAPPSVIVRDARGNPVSGITVQFIVTAGGGSVTGGNAVTAANGIASVGRWTLGSTAGTQTLVARLQGLPDVVFTATATAGDAAAVQAVTVTSLGNVQANSLVATPPSVRVVDGSGNPIAGVTVTFTPDPAGTSGTVTGGTQVTNASGIATVTSWRVGTIANTTAGLRVFVDGFDQDGAEVVFSATVTAGVATFATVGPGAVLNQTNQINTGGAVTAAPSVRITDAFGNGVANATVVFTPEAGSGTVNAGAASASLLTNAIGVATLTNWTIPAGINQTYTLTATSSGVTSVVFTAVTAP